MPKRIKSPDWIETLGTLTRARQDAIWDAQRRNLMPMTAKQKQERRDQLSARSDWIVWGLLGVVALIFDLTGDRDTGDTFSTIASTFIIVRGLWNPLVDIFLKIYVDVHSSIKFSNTKERAN